MTCELRFVSLQAWPYAVTKNRRNSPFSADYNDTLSKLKRELAAIGARVGEVRIPYHPTELRADGMPYAKAKPHHPGVVVVANTRYGPLAFHGDTINDWRANLRAIAAHLEHLRLAQLYGVGTKGEAYQGYKQLPEGEKPEPPPARPSNVRSLTPEEQAAYVLLNFDGRTVATVPELHAVMDSATELKRVYRSAAAKVHPDVGGSQSAMRQVNDARDVLTAYQQQKGIQ